MHKNIVQTLYDITLTGVYIDGTMYLQVKEQGRPTDNTVIGENKWLTGT